MSRWADIDAIIDMSISVLCGGGNEEMAVLVEDINSIPSIEIIRCRECKHWSKYRTNGNESYCEMLYGYTDGDKYCAWGERKGNE